jgi:glycosyltransferase involved in cell wall biosynthesis
VEAMSYGLIPVVINKGGASEIVSSGINGFLWNTENECVSITKDLILNQEKMVKISKKASERANDFSVEEFYSGFEKIIKIS